jgi:cysteine desulfurase
MVYLDNNATTPLDPAVLEVMLPFLRAQYGNPSSTHRFGQEARRALEEARHRLSAFLGCDARELIFTSGGTESDNAAIHGLLAARAPRNIILTSSVEHSAVREPLAQLARSGYLIVPIPVSQDGQLDMPALQEALATHAAQVALATIMWVNNETGTFFDIQAVGELCRKNGVPFHVDAVQAVGKIPFAVHDLPIDALSVSGHKFHGPKGTGALYLRRGVRWRPWQRGGPQERDRRGGTENVPGIVGMGKAADLAAAALRDPDVAAGMARRRDRLQSEILARIPDSHVIGIHGPRVHNTANIAFAGLEAEAILLLLSEHDLCASAGAACSSGSLEPSPVLRAMGIPDRIAHGAIRFSLSRMTTDHDIDSALQILPPIIDRLRATLPV